MHCSVFFTFLKNTRASISNEIKARQQLTLLAVEGVLWLQSQVVEEAGLVGVLVGQTQLLRGGYHRW